MKSSIAIFTATLLALNTPSVSFATANLIYPNQNTLKQHASHHNVVLAANSNLGFSAEELNAKIYLLEYAGGQYKEWKSFGEFIKLLQHNPKIKRVEARYIQDGDDIGVGIKYPGRPLMVVLFKRDQDEMFPTWLGNDSQLHPIKSAMDQQQIADVIRAIVEK